MKTRMGLDRYMFIRLLRMGIILFSICTLFCVPILIPLNVIDGIGSSGINVMTLGNVRYTARTWAHTWLAVLVSGKFSKGTGVRVVKARVFDLILFVCSLDRLYDLS